MQSISAQRNAATVLVVDDDPVFRSLTRDTLAGTGIAVIEADDGLAAAERCRDAAPSLLVVDALMPGMDGFELCRELRGRDPTRQTPILMVTGLQDRDALDRAYEAGATDFIMKPVEWESFQQRVRYMLRNARAAAPPPRPAARDGNRAAAGRVSVLIADDDPVVRSVIRDALEDEGYEVFEAADGFAAFEACREAAPGMVIADIMMPRMNGFELCRMLRRQPETAHIPILVATGLNDHQSIATAYDVGATDFIVKPFNWLILKYRIRYMLRAARTFGEMVAAKERAEAADREKSSFLANMSHELRTPLNAVIGFSEIMHRQVLGPIGEQYAEYAKIIGDSGSHLLTIITDLLDLAKAEAQGTKPGTKPGAKPDDETAAIAETVAFSASMVETMARDAGIACAVEVEDALPAFRGDGKKVQQILINLLTNAIKFTPAGGSVRLMARRDLAGGVVLEVADTGIGIPPDKIETALAPFGQIHSPQARQDDGVGLGLPLTKRLVELHDGTLEIASEPGAGTTVTVHFPPSCLAPAPPPIPGLN
ncbi:MAG TPA: response regulator [Stellaceae bacterium]|nr:response regulator [Stellaceae bacterium]